MMLISAAPAASELLLAYGIEGFVWYELRQ